MRITPALALCAALVTSAAAALPAWADAIPMPEELSADQQLLIGVWQEDNPVLPEGLGHSFMLRTVAFGNTDVTILTWDGVAPANMYGSEGMRGTWSAKRTDAKTLVVTLDQGEGRGKVLTLVFDGDKSFTLSDSELSRFPASKFHRVSGVYN